MWIKGAALFGALVSCLCLSVGASEVSATSYTFALNLLRELATDKSRNIIFSPTSISVALAMLQQGALENSATQLETVLQMSAEQTKEKFSLLLESVMERHSLSTLKMENRAYVSNSTKLNNDYKETLKTDFLAGIENIDFNHPRFAAYRINSWIANVTMDKIRDLVSESSLSEDTSLLLLNAVYFRGLWEKPFQPLATNFRKFRRADDEVKVQYMNHKSEQFNSGEDNQIGARYVEFLFKGEDYSMLAIQSSNRSDLDSLVAKLTAESVMTMTRRLKTRRTTVSIPKFKVTYKTSLKESLMQLGLKDIFDESANLNGIASVPLVVSDVIHKAELDVNEEGGTAAAASGIFIHTLSLYTDELFIYFDHPFLVFIVDKVNDVPLFVGRVNDPSKS